jgi:adenosylmethionine-8-amino-7-oxononanoate aminotransferase
VVDRLPRLRHPHIRAAVEAQLATLPHVMFAGLVHEPAARLATRLGGLLPGDLERVFFTESGSVAVEVALKMAIQYWRNKGQAAKQRIVCFRHGYHGDTFATMALCDPEEGMHACLPAACRSRSWPNCRPTTMRRAFDLLLETQAERVAAVIVEPLVQGAGGMKMHDAATLAFIAEACRRHEVLLIADEIMTGFGRTGRMFACEEPKVVPDILCLSKALTGGTLPLAATVARRHVFEPFLSDDPGAALMHGPTYMANPLACAAANASLDLFEQRATPGAGGGDRGAVARRAGRPAAPSPAWPTCASRAPSAPWSCPAPIDLDACAGAFPSWASGCGPSAAWCT